jgi:hypothetical protein
VADLRRIVNGDGWPPLLRRLWFRWLLGTVFVAFLWIFGHGPITWLDALAWAFFGWLIAMATTPRENGDG